MLRIKIDSHTPGRNLTDNIKVGLFRKKHSHGVILFQAAQSVGVSEPQSGIVPWCSPAAVAVQAQRALKLQQWQQGSAPVAGDGRGGWPGLQRIAAEDLWAGAGAWPAVEPWLLLRCLQGRLRGGLPCSCCGREVQISGASEPLRPG